MAQSSCAGLGCWRDHQLAGLVLVLAGQDGPLDGVGAQRLEQFVERSAHALRQIRPSLRWRTRRSRHRLVRGSPRSHDRSALESSRRLHRLRGIFEPGQCRLSSTRLTFLIPSFALPRVGLGIHAASLELAACRSRSFGGRARTKDSDHGAISGWATCRGRRTRRRSLCTSLCTRPRESNASSCVTLHFSGLVLCQRLQEPGAVTDRNPLGLIDDPVGAIDDYLVPIPIAVLLIAQHKHLHSLELGNVRLDSVDEPAPKIDHDQSLVLGSRRESARSPRRSVRLALRCACVPPLRPIAWASPRHGTPAHRPWPDRSSPRPRPGLMCSLPAADLRTPATRHPWR